MIDYLNWGAEHPWLFIFTLMTVSSVAWAIGIGLAGLRSERG